VNLLELGDAARAALLQGARAISLQRNACAYMPGDDAGYVYAIERGRIKIVRTSSSGAESIVGIRNPGDIFGELTWLGENRTRATSAIALDPSDVLRLDAATLEERLLGDVALAAAFARGIARRLSELEGELTELAGKSVPGRLVDVLGRLATDHGVMQDDGTMRIGISLTHKDLADLIGTSRETLTKELGVLADIGLLRVAQRTIVLIQPRAFPLRRRRE
jgi:CRP-like cAMP-binding protein